MFDWIKFIGEFIVGLYTGITDLFNLFSQSYLVYHTSMMAAPDFLYSIMSLVLAVAIIMWVVNIL